MPIHVVDDAGALRRATDASAVAAEASKLLLQLRGLLAEANVDVPSELETKLYAWLAAHVGK